MPLGPDSLIQAAEKGHRGVIRRHIESGGDVNLRDDRRRTALRQAIFYNKVATVAFLLSHGASIVGMSKFDNLLAYVKRTDIASLLIKNGGDVNGKNELGRSPLFNHLSQPTILRFLLQEGANPNQVDNYGFTPMMYAAQYDHFEAVKIMAANGGDWRVTNSRSGKSVLDYATPQIRKWYERYAARQ